jgi:hypothetical protein
MLSKGQKVAAARRRSIEKHKGLQTKAMACVIGNGLESEASNAEKMF